MAKQSEIDGAEGVSESTPENGESSTQAAGEDSLLGKILDGKYRVIEKLGGGGMGAVYRAEHLLLRHDIALKVLHSHLVSDDEHLQRFNREAHTVFGIKHPHVITLHDFGVANGLPYLAMDFIPGLSVKGLLKERGSLELTEVYHVGRQILSALAEAHAHGVIHRDLKPDNVMVMQRPDGTMHAYVLDFGISKVLRQDLDIDPLETRPGIVIGSPQYLAPEQVMQKEVDSRADLYAFGTLLYQMLTGDVPFSGETALATMVKHVNEKPPAPRDVAPDKKIPEAVNAFVLRLLEKDPANRFQSAEESLRAFDDAFQSIAGVARPSAKLNPLHFAAAIAVGLVIAGLVLAFAPKGLIGPKPVDPEAMKSLQRELDELRELKSRAAEEVAEAERLAEQRKLEAELAAEETARLKREADRTEQEAERRRLEAEQIVKDAQLEKEKMNELTQSAESQMAELEAKRREELQKAEEMKIRAAKALEDAEKKRLEAEEAARVAKARKEETKRVASSVTKLEAEAATKKTTEKRSVTKQPVVQDDALKRKIAEEQRRLVELQRQREIAARELEAARRAAELKKKEEATQSDDAEDSDDTSLSEHRRRLPRQGKRR